MLVASELKQFMLRRLLKRFDPVASLSPYLGNKTMSNLYLRDYGVPIEVAAKISGFERGAFTILRAAEAFGPANADPVPRASLLEVAAARALMEAELLGVSRERALPVITQIGDAAYVRLAMLELSRRNSDPTVTVLARNMHSDEGLSQLQSCLGVRSRNAKRFFLFDREEFAFSDEPPPPESAIPFIDIWKISQRIQNNVGGVIFHGGKTGLTIAA